MIVLAPAGHVNQSASEIPAGGAPIASNLCLRCKRESGCRQAFSRVEVCGELSRPLNGYKGFVLPLPSVDEQERIVDALETLSKETQRLTHLYERKLAALEELKKSLLHQAFNGEL